MKVSVVGTGYVGLVSGVCLAEKGHDVTCVDNDSAKVEKINNATSPIYEKGLDNLLSENIGKHLRATADLRNAVLNSDVSLVTVGTPFDGNEIDLKYVRQVAKDIGKLLKEKSDYHVVIIKSTVVPGTTDNVVIPLLEEYSGKKAGKDFGVGMNPEFLREGVAIDDFMNPDRIVLGGLDLQTHEVMDILYDPFIGVDVMKTNNKTAEMIKYTSNSLFATLISFTNEIGNLCAALGGVDVFDVMKGVHLDKRISPILEDGQRIVPAITTYMEAGCGFGGSCFPKDVKALASHGESVGQKMSMLKAVIDINHKQPQKVLDLLWKHYPDVEGLKVAVLGLAFKPGTDDMRESPSIPIINNLVADKAIVRAYDPIAEEQAKHIFHGMDITYCVTVDDTVRSVDVILLLTRWPEFKDLSKILSRIGINPLIVDGRRMLYKDRFKFYEGIGF
jgi:UDPglucose 6-dehydrogenase/GDP-mannose 6-dehydrogenase